MTLLWIADAWVFVHVIVFLISQFITACFPEENDNPNPLRLLRALFALGLMTSNVSREQAVFETS